MAENACKPKRGGRKSRALRIEELERENARLRATLHLGAKTYESAGVQEFRDLMAAEALVAEWGNEEFALVRLGLLPAVRETRWAERESLAQRVLRTPAVLAHVERMLHGVEERRSEMLQRHCMIACTGTDDAAIRAFEPLSRLLGWKEKASLHVQAEARRSVFLDFVSSVATNFDNPSETYSDRESANEDIDRERECIGVDTASPLPWD